MVESLFNLAGKVALISGASKGIGLEIGRMLGLAGAKVVISSRKEDAIQAAAESLKEEGIAVLGIAAHMGDPLAIEMLVEKTVSEFGGIDIVVNNAAANPIFGPVIHADIPAFDKIMDVNVKGPFLLANLAYHEMKKRGGGSVINISSIGGLSPEPNLGIYSVSKAALISLTKVQAMEWGKDGIRANVICPGLIRTKFSEALWRNDKVVGSFLKQLAIGRVGEPHEIAGLALFLASDASGYCTGAVFTADGGMTI
jgi:NAD(P)-dependent dehydrogenase (short-subunit alcohol dehydrogenase family)